MLEKRLTGGCRSGRRGADEQELAESVLKELDTLADGGLGEAESRGGSVEPPFVDHRGQGG